MAVVHQHTSPPRSEEAANHHPSPEVTNKPVQGNDTTPPAMSDKSATAPRSSELEGADNKADSPTETAPCTPVTDVIEQLTPPANNRTAQPQSQTPLSPTASARAVNGVAATSARIVPELEATRASLIGQALQGFNSFKSSWLSVVLLKGTIGLGQVVVLVVLLVLAGHRASPQYPDQRQTAPSDACPHSSHLIAWMRAQMARLIICWCVSLWICLRHRRAVSRLQENRYPLDYDDLPALPFHRTVPTEREVPTPLRTTPPRAPRRQSEPTAPAQPMSPPTSTSQAESGQPRVPSPSPTDCQISVHRPVDHNPHLPDADITDIVWPTPAPSKRASSPPPSRRTESHVPQVPPQPDLVGPDGRPIPVRYRHLAEMTSAEWEAYQAERRYDPMRDDDPRPIARSYRFLDKVATHLQTWLAMMSLVLFILGNVFVFHPLPNAPGGSCYTASPLLWWGVMSIIGVGWFLFTQIFLIVGIVGIGGQVTLALFRRLGFVEPLPPPVQERDPRPYPLKRETLNQLPLVCYVPSAPNSTVDLHQPVLSYEPVRLDKDHAVCAICQESFVPHWPIADKEADDLRQLPCKHVYHAECIDFWLLNEAGNCPTCNRCVWTMLHVDKPSSARAAQSIHFRRQPEAAQSV